MNTLLTSPELINCVAPILGNQTIAHEVLVNVVAAHNQLHPAVPSWEKEAFIWFAKWTVSKGIDLTIPNYTRDEHNYGYAHDYGLGIADFLNEYKQDPTRGEIANQMAQILKPPPAAATKSCAEVDGQTPPANEYCIVAENMQESFKARLVVPGFDGYEHKTTAVSSGVGFRKDWKSTIIFTCRAPAGQSCEGLPYADDPLGPGIDADNFELYVRCGNTINLLDVDSIDGGKSETIDVIEVTNEYPYSRNCTAKSSQPFTLRIQTTRLAK